MPPPRRQQPIYATPRKKSPHPFWYVAIAAGTAAALTGIVVATAIVISLRPKSSPQPLLDAATESVEQGGVKILVDHVAVQHIPLAPPNRWLEPSSSKEKYLKVYLTITNTDPNHVTAYAGISRNQIALKDNFGNRYNSPQRFNDGYTPNYPLNENERLMPGKPLTDWVHFSEPVSHWESLELELPHSCIGGTGVMRFRIPKSMLKTN